jgi:hypothetical protein
MCKNTRAAAGKKAAKAADFLLFCGSMIRKSGNRLSEKIMLKQEDERRA